MFNKLAGKIKEVYGTQEKFAKALGLSDTSLIKRMKGTVDWKSEEMFNSCVLLGIPFDEMHLYFYPKSREIHTTAEE